MALNQSHAANGSGIVLFYGERLLIFYDGCDFKLASPTIKGNYHGRVYLTSHRVIFCNKKPSEEVVSFSMPFVNMREVDIKQPIFGPNRIEGKVVAEPNGGWLGEAQFSLVFKRGGAIEFGQTLLELGRRASDAGRNFRPPPYQPSYDMNGAAQYYACPPPVYTPPYGDPYFGFVRSHETFSSPEAHTLYQVGAPPPYPGAGPQPAQPPPASAWGSAPQPPRTSPWGSAPPPSTQTPYNAGASSQPGSAWGPNQNMSASHAAKAQEAAESANQSGNHVTGGYYFPSDPHTVYAQPSAPPPPETNAPDYSDVCGPPPAYSAQLNGSNPTDERTKKNQ